MGERAAPDTHAEERVDLVRALTRLPRRQREVVVFISRGFVRSNGGCCARLVERHGEVALVPRARRSARAAPADRGRWLTHVRASRRPVACRRGRSPRFGRRRRAGPALTAQLRAGCACHRDRWRSRVRRAGAAIERKWYVHLITARVRRLPTHPRQVLLRSCEQRTIRSHHQRLLACAGRTSVTLDVAAPETVANLCAIPGDCPDGKPGWSGGFGGCNQARPWGRSTSPDPALNIVLSLPSSTVKTGSTTSATATVTNNGTSPVAYGRSDDHDASPYYRTPTVLLSQQNRGRMR